MDINLIKDKLASLKNRGNSAQRDLSKLIWKPTVGKHQVRVVPSKFDKSNPFTELYFHYGIGKRTMIALTNFKEKDPIVEFIEQLKKANDKSNYPLIKKLTPKMRIFVPVIVRGEESEGVKLWEFGKQIYMELLAIAEDEDIADYTDPIKGYDLYIETTDPATNGTGFNQSKVRIKPKSTALADNEKDLELWLTEQPNPMELFKKYDYTEIKDALVEFLTPESEDEGTSEVKAAAEEVKPVEQPKEKVGYKLNVKPGKDVDKEFRDLFGDKKTDFED